MALAAVHPIVVHFAVACLLVGVLFHGVALCVRAPFAAPAGAALLVLGTVAAVLAVASGEEARVAAEAVPGTAPLVREHAAWGRRARDVFLVLAPLDVLALAWPRPALRRAIGVLGLVGAVAVVETGRRGGELVYARAAGVGVRSGDPADVGWLLVAGLQHQADLDARAGRSDAAAELVELAARRFPREPGVAVAAADTALHARHDPARALALLRAAAVPPDDPPMRFRHAWLESEALAELGDADGARAVLEALRHDFPDSDRVRRRLAGLRDGPTG